MSRMFRRILSLFVVVIICFGLFVSNPPYVKAIKNFTVEVTPNVCGEVASYSFQFTFEDTLEPSQWKSFTFPPGTTLNPPLPEGKKELDDRLRQITNAFSFGNRESFGAASYGMPIVEFKSDSSLNIRLSGGGGGLLLPDEPNGKTITMHFSEKAGISNPSKPGTYIYQLQTTLYPTMESQSVTISNLDTIIIQLTLGSTEATVNGEAKTLPLAPFVQKGYTLVPFRFIGESLNATVDFTTDPTTKKVKTVIYELDDIEIVLTIGSLQSMVNGKEILLDVPPQIKNGTTVVPLRFVSTNLGCMIDWDPVQLKITVTYPEKPNNGDTLAVVETFDALWLRRAFWNGPRIELNQELGPDKVAFITYYVDSKDDHPFPRLSCPESELRMKWYMQDKGLPTAFFNGIVGLRGTPNSNSPEEAIKAVKDEKTYQIKIDIEVVTSFSGTNLQLVTILTESNIPYNDISGQKIHYFVFREYLKPKEIKDTIGIPITLSKPGDKFSTEFTFELNTELYKNDLNLIFFVQDMTQKTILQGLTIPLIK